MAKNSFEPILPFQLFIYELGGTLLDYASSEKDLGVIVNFFIIENFKIIIKKLNTLINGK